MKPIFLRNMMNLTLLAWLHCSEYVWDDIMK